MKQPFDGGMHSEAFLLHREYAALHCCAYFSPAHHWALYSAHLTNYYHYWGKGPQGCVVFISWWLSSWRSAHARLHSLIELSVWSALTKTTQNKTLCPIVFPPYTSTRQPGVIFITIQISKPHYASLTSSSKIKYSCLSCFWQPHPKRGEVIKIFHIKVECGHPGVSFCSPEVAQTEIEQDW